MSGNEFAELIPSLSLELRIIHDVSESKPEIKIKREFIDAYSCDLPDSEPLINSNDKFMKSIKQKFASTSEYALYPGRNITTFIIKSGGVLKHEYLAYQALSQMKENFIL